jgi:hypothetical protein
MSVTDLDLEQMNFIHRNKQSISIPLFCCQVYRHNCCGHNYTLNLLFFVTCILPIKDHYCYSDSVFLVHNSKEVF